MWKMMIGMVCGLGVMGLTIGGPNFETEVTVGMRVYNEETKETEIVEMNTTRESAEILGWTIIEED